MPLGRVEKRERRRMRNVNSFFVILINQTGGEKNYKVIWAVLRVCVHYTGQVDLRCVSALRASILSGTTGNTDVKESCVLRLNHALRALVPVQIEGMCKSSSSCNTSTCLRKHRTWPVGCPATFDAKAFHLSEAQPQTFHGTRDPCQRQRQSYPLPPVHGPPILVTQSTTLDAQSTWTSAVSLG
jgi:hypothetical protein